MGNNPTGSRRSKRNLPSNTTPGMPAAQEGEQTQGTSRFSCRTFAILSAGLMLLAAMGAAYYLFGDGRSGPGQDPDQNDDGLGTGDVQVTLRWSNAADLDLYVRDPLGEEIWFNHRTSNSGGKLDVDANANCTERKLDPIENVFWPTGLAPSGEYRVFVNYFAVCENAGPTRIEVVVKNDAEIVTTYTDTINPEDGHIFITNFIH